MSLSYTVTSLESILGQEVPEVYLTVAKSSVMGLDSEHIANTLGLERAEIDDLQQEELYKKVRLLVGAEAAKDRVERDGGWDGVESTAVKKLARRVELENDTDTLLRIAAVANRATRRVAPQTSSIMDPAVAGSRVPLTLTKRYTEKLNASGGVMERTVTQQISVLNGSAVNPTFNEVRGLLEGSVTPVGAPQTNEEYIDSTEDDQFSTAAMEELARQYSRK